MSMWINRSLMSLDMFVGLCTTEAMFHRELRKMKVDKKDWPEYTLRDSGATAHFFIRGETTRAFVCIRGHEKHSPIQVAGLLVHEAVHIFQRHCRDIGERSPSSEFEAYSIQQISQNLMAAFVQQTGGSK